jgi:CheY-like chemotaxis protein
MVHTPFPLLSPRQQGSLLHRPCAGSHVLIRRKPSGWLWTASGTPGSGKGATTKSSKDDSSSWSLVSWEIAGRRPWQRFGMRYWFRVSVVRVLVVDDFAGFRDAICSMLRNRPDMLVVGEASDGLEAVRKAEDLQPDLIVLNLSMPKLNGLEATRRIRMLSPKSKIIIASLESSADFVLEALRSGAAGYVIKAEMFNQLLPAIDAVLQGKRWFVGQVDDIR